MTDKQNDKNARSEFGKNQIQEAREMLAPFESISPTETSKERWLLSLNSRKTFDQNASTIPASRTSKRRFLEIALAACLGFGLSSFLQHFSNQSIEHEENIAFDATEVHFQAKSE
jgi:hypothetical protein